MTDRPAPTMRPYGRHILICEHGDCAEPEAAARLQQRFRMLAQAQGLSKLRNPERVKCTLSGCLGVCAGGPILAVYPDGIWYHHVDEALIERIVAEHLVAGQPVEEAIFHRQGTTSANDQLLVSPDGSGDLEDAHDQGVVTDADADESRTAADNLLAADEDAPAAGNLPAADEDAPAAGNLLAAATGTQLASTPEADARRKAARADRKHKGLVIVNTGNGKGKTTAALGVLTRAWGRDLRVGGIQFFKHENASFGELRALERMGIMLTPMGDGFTWTSRDLDETQARALHGWEVAKQRISSAEYDIFLLDEFTYVLHFGWLDTTAMIDWLREHKPPMLHLIITGRDASPELIAFADLVTEMREVKHPFREQGIRAQKGIEF